MDILAYAEGVGAESPVATSIVGRDCEIQALCELYLVGTGEGSELLAEVAQSRVNTRRKFLGEWTDDGGPFSETEVLQLRQQVKPWDFPPEFRALLERIFSA